MRIDASPIAIALRVNGQEVAVDPRDGHVGRLPEGKATMYLAAPKGHMVHAFMQTGKRDLQPKRPEVQRSDLTCHALTMTLKRADNPRWKGAIHTAEYPQNALDLVMPKGNGRFVIGKASLSSQAGEFFLVTAWHLEVGCFRYGRHIVCPHFEESQERNWLQMAEALCDIVTERQDQVPHISEYRPQAKVDAKGLGPNQGRVAMFNQASGVGVLLTAQGAANYHWSEIPARPRRRFLVSNEIVRFDSLVEPENAWGRASSLKFQAVGITPMSVVPPV